MAGLRSVIKQAAEHTGMLSLALRTRRSAPLILMYHGVSGEETFPGLRNSSRLHLRRSVFVEHVRVMKRYRRVVGVTEMARGLRDGEDMRNTVALTFDDGYLNNLEHAAAVLSDFNIPGSFFLTTAYIGTNRWMWTDLVEYALDQTKAKQIAWAQEPAGLPLESLEQKRAALKRIKAALKLLSVTERDIEVAKLLAALKVDPQLPVHDYRFMDWQQARSLVDAGFEVGAHTVNHAILSRLPPEQANAEIIDSRDALIKGTGQCCPIFCYPNGKKADYTPAVMDTCRRHFEGAIATNRGPAKADELFELGRLGMDGSASELAWALLQEF